MPTRATSGPASLRPFFEPSRVAVIGAGRHRGVGAAIFRNLLADFTGQAFPVNPHAEVVAGVPAFRSVEDIPVPIDLAIIAVPAAAVEATLDACIRKGVPAVVVISAGFAETGAAGRAREQALRDKVRAAGVRMIGPNCLGLVNTDPAYRLNASFAPVLPPAGSIAFSSQSGALGLAVLAFAARLNVGVSAFVSVGNKADLSTNDLIEYWEHDPRTSVILMYVESFGNPRRFSQIARRVGRTTPIVAVKAGRSRAGARAASSHTGALAENDEIVDALFLQAGVTRTETLEEMFDVAALLAHQPLPAGRRIAILTNAGGPGILAADACDAHGLQLPALAADTTAALRTLLPATASIGNPVDMIATASADQFRRAVPLLLADPGVDALLTIFIPPLVTDPVEIARAIAKGAQGSAKPVLASFFGAPGATPALGAIPCYVFPESAVRALAHVVSYAAWRRLPPEEAPAFTDIDRRAVGAIVAGASAAGGGWTPPAVTSALLAACHIPTAATTIVGTAKAAVAAAEAAGYPVVLKGAGARLLHKTEARAVITDLIDAAAVRHAFDGLAGREEVEHILVQPMVRGVEMFVGGLVEPSFGPVVVCGRGGTLVELLRDTTRRLTPVTERASREMLEEIRGTALLRGYRGAPRLDEEALRAIVLRVSWLLDACPEIVELDLNPVIVTESGAVAVDARIRLAS